MPDQFNVCNKENLIKQLLEVQAEVTVTPLVEHGNPKVYCLESSIKPNSYCCNYKCHNCNYCNCCSYEWYNCKDNQNITPWECGDLRQQYNYTLTQVICVEIPLSIDADVNIKEGIVSCGRPDVKPINNKNEHCYMQVF
ncbi:MAG: hypothetical protein AB9836_12195 [Aminipila sp.]